MKKNVISEISRIHELMNVNSDKLLLENRWCPFCDAVLKQVDELVSAYSLKNVPAREINLKINDLLEKVKKNTDLTINERAALTQAIENLKKSGDEMGDVAKYAERARTEIRAKADVLSEIPVTKITYNYADELYSTKEFADDFVEYGGVDVPGITEAYEGEFKINGSFYQEKYATFDEWFDADFKIQIDALLQNKGYTNKTFRDNVIENMRNRFKNNQTINTWDKIKKVFYKSGDDRTIPKRFGKDYNSIDDEFYALSEMNKVDYHFVKPINLEPGKGYTMEEFPNSKTLSQYVEDGNKISEELSEKIKTSFKNIHENGLAHGDINANNILINSDGSDFRIIDPVGYPPKNKGFKDFESAKIEDLNALDKMLDEKNVFKINKTPDNPTNVIPFLTRNEPEIKVDRGDNPNYWEKTKNEQPKLKNFDPNIESKQLPTTQFHVGGTSIDNVRSPGWREISGSDPKIVKDDHSAFIPNAPGMYQYFSFTTREYGENIIYSFHRKDIFDAAGRQGNFIVAVSYPKNSGVSLNDVKQILVDKSDEIHQQWLEAYNKKSGGVSIGGIKTPETAKSIGVNSKGLSVSEIPVIQR